MKINLVTVQSRWILQHMAERIAATDRATFTLSHFPSYDADANFYIDVYNCYQGKTAALDIGHFTHVHENDIKYTDPKWLTLDYVFHYGRRYYDFWHDQLGYPKEKMKIVPPGEFPKTWRPRKPKLGIFQRGGHEGKGFQFMQSLGEFYENIQDFAFMFVGDDWDAVVEQYRAKGVTVAHVKDSDVTNYYEQYDQLYELIDYLLIPSLWEGGPMCMIEAAGKGIPIISADVGFVSDFSYAQYMFDAGNLEQLIYILEGIRYPLYKQWGNVRGYWDWKQYAQEIVATVKDLQSVRPS